MDGVCKFVTLFVAEARGGKSTASKDGLQDQGNCIAEQPYLIGLQMMRKAVLEATPGLSSFRLILSMLTLGGAFPNSSYLVLFHPADFFPELDRELLVPKLHSKTTASSMFLSDAI